MRDCDRNMKNVMISITGMQDYGADGDDTVELVTDGQYCYADGHGRLVYMESELTGLEGTKTSFTIEPMSVVMQREGRLNTRMVFEEGKKHLFLYETPYGTATMTVDTSRISTRLDEHGGDMEIDYVLDFEHSAIGRNKFRINVRELNA